MQMFAKFIRLSFRRDSLRTVCASNKVVGGGAGLLRRYEYGKVDDDDDDDDDSIGPRRALVENLPRSAWWKPKKLGGRRNSGKLCADLAGRLDIRESWWPIKGGRVSELTSPGDGGSRGEDTDSWDAESEMRDGVWPRENSERRDGEVKGSSRGIKVELIERNAFEKAFGDDGTETAYGVWGVSSCSSIDSATSHSSWASARGRRPSLRLLFIPPFHQFFTALSLRPCSLLAISAQRFPISPTSLSMTTPSSGVMGSWFSVGFRFWWYRSLHCLGDRDPTSCDILTQLWGPCTWTSCRRLVSSCCDQGPLLCIFDVGNGYRNLLACLLFNALFTTFSKF